MEKAARKEFFVIITYSMARLTLTLAITRCHLKQHLNPAAAAAAICTTGYGRRASDGLLLLSNGESNQLSERLRRKFTRANAGFLAITQVS